MSVNLTPKTMEELNPNHPFAHSFVLIGKPPIQTPKPPLPTGEHGVIVSVSWGYESHWVDVDAADWQRIRNGETVMLCNEQWYEGKPFNCYWMFNMNPECSLVVDYGEDGGTGFNGDIRDAWIHPRLPGEKT